VVNDGFGTMAAYKQSVRDFRPVDANEPITVAIPNYNGKPDIADALRSVQDSTYLPTEILVVDDGSTDGSVSFIRKNFPDVRVIELGRNSGGMLNRVRNRALREARTRLVFLMDHDIILEPDCLSVLLSQMRALPNAAVLTTRALFEHDRQRIYVDAQSLHFLCNTVASNRDGYIGQSDNKPTPSVGWGTQLIDKDKALVVGFFDEDYGMGWGDDGEFHHKIRLAGFGCYSVPTAVVYHKRVEGANRVSGTVRNRWYIIIETYALKTLVLLAPALVLYEAALLIFLCLKGHRGQYLGSMREVFRKLPQLLKKRSELQRSRRIPDKELLVGGPIYIRANLLEKSYLRFSMTVLNGMFEGYWRLVKHFV
jgi:GT2 family glycosyltransferase